MVLQLNLLLVVVLRGMLMMTLRVFYSIMIYINLFNLILIYMMRMVLENQIVLNDNDYYIMLLIKAITFNQIALSQNQSLHSNQDTFLKIKRKRILLESFHLLKILCYMYSFGKQEIYVRNKING